MSNRIPSVEKYNTKINDTLTGKLKGKVVKEVIYSDGYCDIEIVFVDGSSIEISGEECFDFHITVI